MQPIMMSVQDLVQRRDQGEIIKGGSGCTGEHVFNCARKIRLQALGRERADGTQAHGGTDLPAHM